MKTIKIQKINKANWVDILNIVKDLYGWFDKVALNYEIPNDLKFHQGLIAKINNKIVGFITYSSFEGEVFISWLGVSPKLQRHGVGESLVKYLEKLLIKIGINKLKVETLSEKIEYEPYVRTRNFYRKLGFAETTSRKMVSKETNEKLILTTYSKMIL